MFVFHKDPTICTENDEDILCLEQHVPLFNMLDTQCGLSWWHQVMPSAFPL